MWQFAISSQCCCPSIQISLFHPLSSHQPTPFHLHSPLFSLSLWLSVSLGLPFSRFLHLFLLVFFFPPSLLFDFFHARCLIKQLQKSKFGFLALCSHLPLCASFSCLSVISFSLSLLLAVSMCSCSAETERSPRTESVGVCEQEWEKERVCLRASLSLFSSVCH